MSQAARTAVVVGASRGLGRGIAKAFSTESYRVTDPRYERPDAGGGRPDP